MASLLIARGFEPSALAVHRFSTPGAIGEKRDRLAVGRNRLALERQAADDARRLAALNRQRVQIAEHVEDDGAAIGRHVERGPRHFVGGERDGLGRLEDQAFGRTVALALFLAASRHEGAGEQNRRRKQQARKLHDSSWTLGILLSRGFYTAALHFCTSVLANGVRVMIRHQTVPRLLLLVLLGCDLVAQSRGPLDLANEAVAPGAKRISYGSGALQFAELRLPSSKPPHPVAIVVHGGCWLAKLGNMDERAVALDNMRPLAAALTDAGIATWNVECRRLGNEGGGWPGTFQDIGQACRLSARRRRGAWTRLASV